MKIGYARVSTLEQNLDLQIDALEKAGCKKIITDEISGSVADRPGLTRLKEGLREGDTVVVWRLDRLGRSLKHLIALVNEFEILNVSFESLQESINTSTSTGQLIFHMGSVIFRVCSILIGLNRCYNSFPVFTPIIICYSGSNL